MPLRNTSVDGLNILDSDGSNSIDICSEQSHRKVPEVPNSTIRRVVTPLKRFRCTNWAVVAPVSKPTDSIRLITSDCKWCIIIVADISSQSKVNYISDLGYSGKRLVFLDPQDQEHLYPDLSTAIQWNHHGRKNIGYMFAIHNGAELIWDFDDTNQTLFDIDIIHKQKTVCILKRCKGSYKVFNPYPYFGVSASNIWPRGFPLKFVHDTATLPGLCVGNISLKEVGVIQSISNIEPDVDAIYKLTRPRSLTKTKVLFSPPYVFQRSSENFVMNFESEIDMYQKAEKLVDFLHSFYPQLNRTLETLHGELFKRGFIELRDINFIKLWIKAYLDASTSN
ncbi:hypothetical protein CHS0354_021842 [Potamilus streckersoni]|uniref:Uncharacterized protein n=1 Tax=Potamilus streckersoni TaxID=2493646 RepID=A0AAE0RQP6_9BIVA|nr:hypothetical protein CHS0354_021842 [Potamilus streckersoni]